MAHIFGGYNNYLSRIHSLYLQTAKSPLHWPILKVWQNTVIDNSCYLFNLHKYIANQPSETLPNSGVIFFRGTNFILILTIWLKSIGKHREKLNQILSHLLYRSVLYRLLNKNCLHCRLHKIKTLLLRLNNKKTLGYIFTSRYTSKCSIKQICQ